MIIKKINNGLLIAALLLVTGSNLFSQAVTWDFPVKPGSEEWKSLNSRSERARVCQIPEDVLPALSTDKLIELCLNYPFIIDIWAFDNILTGFDKYSEEFNGFQELIRRSDAALVLIKKYKDKDPLAIDKDWSSYDKYDYDLKISIMELFLCNKEILSNLDTDEKKDLMNEYRLKKSQKNNRIDLYQGKGFQTICLAMVKLLGSENIDLNRKLNMDNVTQYVTTGILISRGVFKEINNAVNNYLLNDLRPISNESTYYEENIQESLSENVYTPKGRIVTAAIQSELYSSDVRAIMDNQALLDYPGAILINTYGGHSATSRFNCHGYAWHVSERGLANTSEYRVIDQENLYWQDYTSSSYIKIATLPYPWYSGPPSYPGKISYMPQARNHSAVIANPVSYPSGWVISKWSDGPLMCHAPDNCPYYITVPPSALTVDVYHLNPNHITGDITPPLCKNTERTFSTDITHLPQALTWNKSGSIAYLRQTDSTYTVKGTGNGTSRVTLNIKTLSDFQWSDYLEFQAIDKPIISDQRVDGNPYQYGMGVRPGVGHWLTYVPYPNYGSITDIWTVPSGIQYSIDQGNHRLGFYFVNNPSLTFTVQATNICGAGPISSYYLTRQMGYVMTLYPNPASDNVTVTMTENIPSTKYVDTTGFIIEPVTDIDTYTESVEPTTFTIRIYNSQSELLYTCKRSGGSINVPLINMKDGAYIVEVNDGENNYRQQLIVKHS